LSVAYSFYSLPCQAPALCPAKDVLQAFFPELTSFRSPFFFRFFYRLLAVLPFMLSPSCMAPQRDFSRLRERPPDKTPASDFPRLSVKVKNACLHGQRLFLDLSFSYSRPDPSFPLPVQPPREFRRHNGPSSFAFILDVFFDLPIPPSVLASSTSMIRQFQGFLSLRCLYSLE